MNSTTSGRRHLFLYLCTLVWLLPFPAVAQYEDNPYLDQLPREFWNQRPPQSDVPLSTVITVNNFDNFNLGVDFGESNMAANPLVPSWLFTAYNTNNAHHTENGIDWANVTPPFGANMFGDPVVTYDSLGNLFYQNMYGSTSIQGVKVIKSTDNGVTWGTSVTAVSGVDKNWMACDQTNGPYANYVYVCMTANSGGNFARSTNHGSTFTTTFSPSTQTLPGMMVCVGPYSDIQGKAVYVVTNSGSVFSSTYTFYRSTDGGVSFSLMSAQNFANTVGSQVNNRHSVENMRTRPYPMIAADNSFGTNRGRLYCVYASNDPPGNGNKPDIWCRYSDNGGTTWSSAIRVNDDTNPQTHHQWHPAIWCDKQTGRLYAMWLDTRNCPTNDTALVYASYSDNGGVTWAANQAISNQKMKINCTTCGGGGTPRYQGDYNGIVSNNKGGIAGWTDYRQGTFLSVAAYFPDFAMALSPASATLYAGTGGDSADFVVSVPAVKLYTDTVVLSGQVTPSPSPGNITFLYPSGNQITSYPGSKTVRVKLTGNVPAGTYQAAFFGKGPNGTPAHQRNATLTVISVQPLSVVVTATPATVCLGNSTQLQAVATGGVPPYTYSWSSNPPGFVSSIANPVATPTVSTWYICTVQDNLSTTSVDSVYVTVSDVPATPGSITGNTTPCESDTTGYSIAAVTGATTYTWSVPAGAVILSGQGSTTISVVWGSTSGNVTVTAGNSCGTSPASQLAVTVSLLPAAPGTIAGPTSVCTNTSASYSITPVTGLTYTWAVPPGATITSGQGTSSITVLFGSSSGTISVSAVNSCGTGPASFLNVTVETLPGDAQAISGPDTVCRGDGGYVYTIPVIPNATGYVWTLPPGAVVSQGQGTNAITVDFGSSAMSGNLTAAGTNLCGTGQISSKWVVVEACTGTGENRLRSDIRLSPNPVHDLLTVSIDGYESQLRIRVLDLQGHLLVEESLKDLPLSYIHRIDVHSFAPGIYLIRITTETRTFNGKFVVN